MYTLFVYQSGFKPPWISSDTRGPKRFARVQDMDGDQIAYAAQSSEAAFVVLERGSEIKAEILKENFRHTDEYLYIAFDSHQTQALQKNFEVGRNQYIIENIDVQFEVKHSYFSNLHKAVKLLSPEVIAKLVPEPSDFRDVNQGQSPLPRHFEDVLRLDDHFPVEQVRALRVAAFSLPTAPPVLISGAFGTGKTRLLAAATYYFIRIQEGKLNNCTIRVLVSAHHQASADTFLECYYNLMKHRQNDPSRLELVRLTSREYRLEKEELAKYCCTVFQVRSKSHQYIKQRLLVIVTTHLTAVHLHDIFPAGFFTHILLDEGAQAREPEAVASLCLATKETKIVIAGDPQQVGPALLVLGEEARENGLKTSLLERLRNVYQNSSNSQLALQSCATLFTNYRCHQGILDLSSKLFYESSLICHVPDSIAHRGARFPLQFMCSGDAEVAIDIPNKSELQVVLDEISKCIRCWPDSWGKKSLDKICIVTPTRSQIVTLRRMASREIKRVRMLTTYEIQGQEFFAVFLNTTEPIWEDWSTCNPTKSVCDPYVFNTVLTRAKALVFCVGNPFTLLRTEQHMVQKYGQKGRCWSEYLKSCLNRCGALNAVNTTMLQSCRAKLENILLAEQPASSLSGSTEGGNHRLTSAQPKLEATTVPKSPKTSGQQQAAMAPDRSASHAKASTSKVSVANVKQATQKDNAIKVKQVAAGEKAIPKPPNSDGKQQPALSRASGASKAASTQGKGDVNSPLASPGKMQKAQTSSSQASATDQAPQKPPVSLHSYTGPSSTAQVTTETSDSSNAKKPPVDMKPGLPLRTPKSVSLENMSKPQFSSKQDSSKKPGHPNLEKPVQSPQVNLDDFPTVESSREKVTKRELRELQHRHTPEPAAAAPRKHTSYYQENKDKLDPATLEDKLTCENYKKKFHDLLCWEEMEHERVLSDRCDGEGYVITVFQRGWKPSGLENDHEKEGTHVHRYGVISVEGEDYEEVISYAKQSSEGSQVFLDKRTCFFVKHVFGNPPRGEEGIVFALDDKNEKKLVECNRGARSIFKFNAYYVKFELKHSYFNGMHKAIDKLTPVVIAKLMPVESNFIECSPPGTIPKPLCDDLELDWSGQMQALQAILYCKPSAPVLVVGPFGTGKTRLLARAAFQILKDKKSRVLVCAHHQASVDTFVEYFGQIKKDRGLPRDANFVRIIPNNNYHSKTREKYNEFYKTKRSFRPRDIFSYRLVISTLGAMPFSVKSDFFTHILMDEGAQTREPESVEILCLANESTKIVIAGDHCQVGPRLLVLGKEAQNYGLGVSLLERLHSRYEDIGDVADPYSTTLLTNYRCHSGILMLPSSLYYSSTLKCKVPEDTTHPSAPFPLVFVCTSFDNSPVDEGNSEQHQIDVYTREAEILLEQVKKYITTWPKTNWGDKVHCEEICIMTPSARQKKRIKDMMKRDKKKYSLVQRIEVLKAYEIQGREFRAIFIGTCEATSNGGEPLNPTKSISDRYVFNTALTRSRSLVVAVGNPFTLLRREVHMVREYGEQGKCWSQYIQRCLDCKSFFPSLRRSSMSAESFQRAKELLYNMVYPRNIPKGADSMLSVATPNKDSILSAYQREIRKIPDYKNEKLTIGRVGNDISWVFDRKAGRDEAEEEKPSEAGEKYKCLLRISHYRKAEAVPFDRSKPIVSVNSPQNRHGAFDGDVVLVLLFPHTEGKHNGKIIEVLESAPNQRFVCRVTMKNSTLFSPIDKKNPLILNLPNLSQRFLGRRNKDVINDVMKSPGVVVFKQKSVEDLDNNRLPEIERVIPHFVAKNMLFVVRVLQRKKNYRLPLGIVVEAIPQGLSFYDTERLLRIVHEVEYNDEDDESSDTTFIASVPHDDRLVLYQRAFTIDPEDAMNLDDAISLKLVKSEERFTQYELAVHIVNAAKHIDKGGEQNASCQDQHARALGTSIYSGAEGKTMHMLPAALRKQITLSPGVIRDVISIVATVVVDSSGRITLEGNVKTQEAQVISSVKLSYKAAQKIKDGHVDQLSVETSQAVREYDATTGQPSLSETLQLLYKIAFSLRQERLHSAAYSYKVEDSERCCWEMHMMIEEFMIWANSVVVERVYSCFNDTALIRRQGAPNEEELAAVVSQHSYVMGYSHSLQQHTNQYCLSFPFLIPNKTFRKLQEAIQCNDVNCLINLLTSDHIYPQLAVAQAHLRSIQQRSAYHCTSSEESKEDLRHHSLNVNLYTHSTSPMRRYFDIQVQRMLLTVHSPSTTNFEKAVHQRMCSDLNAKQTNAKQFEKSMKKLILAQECASSSQVMEGFIVSNKKGMIELCFPDFAMECLSFSERKIAVKHLGSLGKPPRTSDADDSSDLDLEWRVKVTSLKPDFQIKERGLVAIKRVDPKRWKGGTPESQVTRKQDDSPVELEMAIQDPSGIQLRLVKFSAEVVPSVVRLDSKAWGRAINFVQNPTEDNLLVLKEDFTRESKDSLAASVPADKCAFVVYSVKRSLSPYDSIKVWMSYSTREAFLAPKLQMVELAPGVRICLEHNSHPAECFSDPLLKYASRPQYNDINEYCALWEKVLLAEASEKSVKERQPVIIRDVSLQWPKLTRPEKMDQDYYQALEEVVVKLPPSFTKELYEFFSIRVGDMVCVRYGTDPHSDARAVFHMVVSKTESEGKRQEQQEEAQENEVRMKFIGKDHCRISEKMKTVLDTEKATCEMQIIAMSTSYQRVYKGLMKLLPSKPAKKGNIPKLGNKEDHLVQNIALGKLPRDPKERAMASGWKKALSILDSDPLAQTLWSASSSPGGIPENLNDGQIEAMKRALKYQFQLIQGPPGTGKSETGAHIAYVFAMLNRSQQERKCVLYCGPSNKAVDVVLQNLHKLNELLKEPKSKMRILRVCGRALERRKYPGPFWNKNIHHKEQSQYELPEWATEYLLHEKIRCGDGAAAKELMRLDKEFEEQSKDCSSCIPTAVEHKDYKLALSSAEKAVLQQHFDIILCTCNETASGRMSRGKYFTVKQCIIDECGMAFEPESMAPISLCEHVVLLGDHKQLQPVIDYPAARDNGLSRSLFQRYAEHFEELCYTLTTQYRMHERVCAFPSCCFYKGELETDESVRKRPIRQSFQNLPFWPQDQMVPTEPKPRAPIVFCDFVGKEGEVRTGSKKGRSIGIGSKYNIEEAIKVVEIASVLHQVYKVPLEQIAILTPYSAQRNEIARLLKEEDSIAAGSIKVASITESQGDEYGIVILSTVRSLPLADICNPDHVQPDQGWLRENLGFVTDEHQINVGITRSKYGLVIVGNRTLLQYDVTWEKLLKHYKERGCIVKARSFPKKQDLGRLHRDYSQPGAG